MRKPSLFIAFGSLVIVAVLPQCGNGTTDCTQTSTCPSDASDGPPALNCDTTKDPKDQPGCLDDRVGVFVDGANGKDSNAGTKEAPFQTIGKALGSVGALTRVYVCEGIYPEDVAITPPVDGISIYGGFKCIAWTYTGNQPQVGKGQIALKISGTTKAFTIQDMLFHAADGNAGNATSIGALVANAAGMVTLNRVNLVAGVGAAGSDAAAGSNYSASLAQSDPSIQGHAASGITGGGPQACTGLCTDTITSSGGSGGTGGGGPGDGSIGLPSLGGGQKGTGDPDFGGSGVCTNGSPGGNATAVGADAVSPTATGTLTENGWTPTASAAGKNGAPGQGGGGGGGGYNAANTSGGGGGGACGGCGGGGGGGGAAGGGSIALASFNSTVTMTSGQLHAGDAGNGGKGGAGQTGQLGGFGGTQTAPGCAGGGGGNGSAGGTGAGGVGGISVDVLYKGTQPNVDGTTQGQMVVGKAGTAGVGGKAGTNDGIVGVAQPFLAAP